MMHTGLFYSLRWKVQVSPMAVMDVQTAGRFQFEPTRDALRMYPGVGGARVELTMKVTRLDERKDGPPCQVTAAMSVGRNANVGQRFLCDLRHEHLINPPTQGTQIGLKGFISDHQLRVIEAIRRGAALWVSLELHVTCADGEPGRLLRGWATEPFDIQPGEWAAALELADAGSYVELLVPLPGNTQNANAVRRLRKARDLMRDDKVEEALGETRKAVEKVRSVYETGRLAAAAARADARQRTKEQRWALYVESIFSLLSGAVHDDQGTTENFTWSRAEADALIVSVAGMLGRLAEDERQHIT
jgi:hypothetical protein